MNRYNVYILIYYHMLSFSSQEIRLFAIDVFWRKLDFKPAKINYENIDVDAEFEKLKKTINLTPPG